ncbi:MAG: arsenite methyltransferase [Actinomycetota bacterium]
MAVSHDFAPGDAEHPDFVDFWDDLSLWSAPFGLALLDRVPLRGVSTIVDVGAGTGFAAIELAQRCGAGTRIIAVDPWLAATQRIWRKVAYYELHNVEVIAQDITLVDLPTASVDVVISNLGINNFTDPPAVLATCGRLLRDDGYLALTTNFSGHMAEFYGVFRDVLHGVGLSESVSALDDHVAHRGTYDGLVTMLTDADFAVVDHHAETFRLRYADGSAFLRHWFIRTAFMPGWRAVLPPGRVGDVFLALEGRLNELAAHDGELAVTVPVDYIGARRRGTPR